MEWRSMVLVEAVISARDVDHFCIFLNLETVGKHENFQTL